MNQLLILLSDVSGKVSPSTATATTATTDGQQVSGGFMEMLFANPLMLIIVYCAVIFGAMYFFSIRPQKKKEVAISEMRSKIKPGDPVVLANGMFGKVVDVTAECFIIEFGTNKGIRIPVLKQEIIAVKEPNLTNKEEVVEEEKQEKKSLLGFGKKKEETEEEK